MMAVIALVCIGIILLYILLCGGTVAERGTVAEPELLELKEAGRALRLHENWRVVSEEKHGEIEVVVIQQWGQWGWYGPSFRMPSSCLEKPLPTTTCSRCASSRGPEEMLNMVTLERRRLEKEKEDLVKERMKLDKASRHLEALQQKDKPLGSDGPRFGGRS